MQVTVTQSRNSLPSTVTTNQTFEAATFSAFVTTADFQDDDFIGWVFGYRGGENFYLVQWKRTDQSGDAWDRPELQNLDISGAPRSRGGDQGVTYRAKAGLSVKWYVDDRDPLFVKREQVGGSCCYLFEL